MYLIGTQKWVTEVQISHNMKIVASSLSFLSVLKSSCLVLFSWRNFQKGWKKLVMRKSITSYLHNGSTLEYNLNRFRKLQFRATTFILAILVIGHVTTISTSHWINPDKQNHHYLDFVDSLVTRSHFLPDRTLTWTLKGVPYCTEYTNSIFLNFPLFFYLKDSNFLFWTCTLTLTRAIWKCANTCKQYSNIVNNS